MRQQNISHYGSLGRGGGGAAKEAARIQKWEEQGRNDLSGLCGAEIALVRWVCSNLINLNPNPCFFLISVPYLASLCFFPFSTQSTPLPLPLLTTSKQSPLPRAEGPERRSLVQTHEFSSAESRLGSRTILHGKVMSSPTTLLLVEVQPSPSLSLSLQGPFLPQHTPSSGSGCSRSHSIALGCYRFLCDVEQVSSTPLSLISVLSLKSPGENKTTTTVFEPNLKQALSNIGQDNGYWPGLYLGLPKNDSEIR